MTAAATIPGALVRAAHASPDTVAFRYLLDDGEQTECVTFDTLARQAETLAVHLRGVAAPGDRVVILCAPGLDPPVALYAAFLAGLVAVPVAGPNLNKIAFKSDALARIVEDCSAAIVLASPAFFEARGEFAAADWRLAVPRWILVDRSDGADAPTHAAVQPGDLAILQYTSGSTSAPKGVMLTHANLMANQILIQEVTDRSRQPEWGLSWLPYYHDMGLSFLLHVPHFQVTCTLMASLHFMQRPLRWLEAISRYGAGCTAVPSFALDHVLRRFRPEDHAGLDLSSMKALIIGAEPLSADALSAFVAALEPFGLDPRAVFPSFGMAEATLMVTHPPFEAPLIRSFDSKALGKGVVAPDTAPHGDQEAAATVTLVGNGMAGAGHRVIAVDPATRSPVGAGRVGEIWLAGASVGAGYWGNPAGSAATFGAVTEPDDGQRYLRTGDLGFFMDDELFVAGRCKELVIVDGRNVYPHDVEEAVREHDALGGAAMAAFEIHRGGRPGLALLIERRMRDPAGAAALLQQVRAIVVNRFEIDVHHLAFVGPFTLPRTTSGKIKRLQCAHMVEPAAAAAGLEDVR